MTGTVVAITLADVDNDGWLDVVVVANGTSRVLRNQHTTTTGSGASAVTTWNGLSDGPSSALTTTGATSVAIGDVNKDGFRDVVVGATTGGTILFLARTVAVTGAWNGFADASKQTLTTDSKTTALALTDLDNDGLLDLFVGSDGTSGTEHHLYLNKGETSGAWAGFDLKPALTTSAIRALAAGDLDGDGYTDIVAVRDGAAPTLYTNLAVADGATAWGGLAAPTVIGASGATPTGRTAALADLDGDGDLDLVSGTTTGTLLYVNDDGVLAASRQIAPAVTAFSLVGVDTDTDLDLVAAGSSTRLYRQVADPQVVIAFSGVTASLSKTGAPAADPAVGLEQGTGVIVLTSTGMAGVISGTISAGSGAARIDATVRINSTRSALDETVIVNGSEVRLTFTETQVRGPLSTDKAYVEISGSGTLRLGPVEIYGTVTFDGSAFTGSATLFFGQGPYKLEDGTINAAARGVVVRVTSGAAGKDSGGKRYLSLSGQVELVGFPGITFIGSVTIKANESTSAQGGVSAATSATVPFVAVSGSLVFNVSGVSFTGGFAFTQTGGVFTITLGAGGDDVVVGLGEPAAGATEPPFKLTITDGSTVEISTAGVAAVLRGTVSINVPGVSITSVSGPLPVEMRLNTTPGTKAIVVGPDTVQVAAGSLFVALGTVAAPAKITIAGQELRGVLSVQQDTLPVGANAPPGSAPAKVVHIGLSNVSFSLGDTTAGVSMIGGTGALVLKPTGIAGRFTGGIRVFIPGGTFDGTLSLAVNTTPTAVIDQVVLGGGSTIALNIPAGPFLRFEGSGVQVTIGGQTLGGDIVLERGSVPGPGSTTVAVTRIAFRNVSAAFGDGVTNVVSLSGGLGIFVLRPAGLAGSISGTVAVTVPGASLVGTFALKINTANGAGTAVSTSISFGVSPATTTAMVLADVNGDSRPDLLVGTGNQGVLVFLNDASGDPFDSVASYDVDGSAGTAVTGLALGDLDHDGDLDLVVGRSGAATELWLGSGAGSFALLATPGLGTGATGVAVGDVDGDGWADVVVGGATNQYFRNLGNTSAGVWQKFAATAAAPGTSSLGVALGDVDGDGKVDLVATTSSATSLYLGTGTGFSSTATSVGPAATSVVLADLTGDGLLDLALATSTGRQVRVNRGSADLTPDDNVHVDEWVGLAPATTVAGAVTVLTLRRPRQRRQGRPGRLDRQRPAHLGQGQRRRRLRERDPCQLRGAQRPRRPLLRDLRHRHHADRRRPGGDRGHLLRAGDRRRRHPHRHRHRGQRPPHARRHRHPRRVRRPRRRPRRHGGRPVGLARLGRPHDRLREPLRLGLAEDQHRHHRRTGRHRAAAGRQVLPDRGEQPRPDGRRRHPQRLLRDRAGHQQLRRQAHRALRLRCQRQALEHRPGPADRRQRRTDRAARRHRGPGHRHRQPRGPAPVHRPGQRQLLAQDQPGRRPR